MVSLTAHHSIHTGLSVNTTKRCIESDDLVAARRGLTPDAEYSASERQSRRRRPANARARRPSLFVRNSRGSRSALPRWSAHDVHRTATAVLVIDPYICGVRCHQPWNDMLGSEVRHEYSEGFYAAGGWSQGISERAPDCRRLRHRWTDCAARRWASEIVGSTM